MRLAIVHGLAATILVTAAPVLAADDLPAGVDHLLTCGTVYSLRSDDAAAEGDEGARTEFFYLGEALLWQARVALGEAGYPAQQIEDISNTYALTTGFRYGGGMAEELLATCLAAEDSP